LYQNARQRHTQIGRYYLLHRGDWTHCDDYGLNSLAIHLAEGDEPARALELLDEDWMRARYQRGGYTYTGFSADVAAIRARLHARAALSLRDRARLASMERAVAELATEFNDSDLATLVLLGRRDEALAHARLRPSPIARCKGLLQIFQMDSKLNSKSPALLQEASQLARTIYESQQRAKILLEIHSAHVMSSIECDQIYFDEALIAVSEIRDHQSRWEVLLEAIKAVTCSGDLDLAERLLAQLRAEIVKFSDDIHSIPVGAR
jgi:hypothetical protein